MLKKVSNAYYSFQIFSTSLLLLSRNIKFISQIKQQNYKIIKKTVEKVNKVYVLLSLLNFLFFSWKKRGLKKINQRKEGSGKLKCKITITYAKEKSSLNKQKIRKNLIPISKSCVTSDTEVTSWIQSSIRTWTGYAGSICRL